MFVEGQIINNETNEVVNVGKVRPHQYAKVEYYEGYQKKSFAVYCDTNGRKAGVLDLNGETDKDLKRLVDSGEAFSEDSGAFIIEPGDNPYERDIANKFGATGRLVLSLIAQEAEVAPRLAA